MLESAVRTCPKAQTCIGSGKVLEMKAFMLAIAVVVIILLESFPCGPKGIASLKAQN